MVRSCHRTTTQRFHDYGDDEEDHQTRQEEQGQRRIFPVFEPPIDNVGLDVTCNPSQADGLAVENGCEDDDCADPVWVTDAKHVCVSITVMPPGAMASEVIIMIITLTTIRRIHRVIPI